MSRVFIVDDEDGLPPSKYKIGDKLTARKSINGFTLSFAYDYISLRKSNLCFDYQKIPAEDYQELYYLKKEISSVTIDDLFERLGIKYKFHSIPITEKNDKKWLIPVLIKLFNIKKTTDNIINQLPELYQIQVYTDNITNKAPRIVGFFGNYGIFHLLWFDYEHSIYPMA